MRGGFLISFFFCLTALGFSLTAFGSSPRYSAQDTTLTDTQKRTVFVQLFEWPWKDVASECENYLGPAGFSAVQVSPPNEHPSTEASNWWERYQVVSYKMQSRGGSEADFTQMVQRCHRAGVDVYADVVMNHMTGMPNGTGSAGSTFTHYDYPGLYQYGDFHHCGRNGDDRIINFNDLFELQNCELVNLADLATESASVQGKQADYLNHLLDLGVAGFRFDAAKHMPARDIQSLLSKLKAKPKFVVQEIILDPSGPIHYSDYTPVGSVTAYNYPYALADGFKYKNIGALYNIPQGLPDSTLSVVFATNHDLERNADQAHLLRYSQSSVQDQGLYRLAQIFMLAWPYGYPQLFSGYNFSNYDAGPPVNSNRMTNAVLDDQGDCVAPWTCEHRLPEVAAMVQFRNQTDRAFKVTDWWTNNRDQLSFSRGNAGFVAMNFSSQSLTQSFKTSLPAGIYCNILAADYKNGNCGAGVQVNADGTLRAQLAPLSAMALLSSSSTSKVKK